MSFRRCVLGLALGSAVFWPVAGQAQSPRPIIESCIKPGTAGMHPFPPYPIISVRTGEQGLVGMLVTIRRDGTVADVNLMKSSGYDRMDRAAMDFLKAHWLWPAFDTSCPDTVTMQVNFNWILPFSMESASGKAVTMGPADYPPAALAAKEQSSAQVTGTLMPDGTVTGLSLTVSSGYPDLDAETLKIAQDQIRKIVMAPIGSDGKPVAVPAQLTVHWTLAPQAAAPR